jgi:hypothetical protein
VIRVGSSIFADVIELRLGHTGIGWVLIQPRVFLDKKNLDTDTQTRQKAI